MSRIANKPVDIPDNVEANINNNLLTVKGPLGEMKLDIHGDVDVQNNDNIITSGETIFDKNRETYVHFGK